MPTPDEFAGDVDYELRWPPEIFADELRRLVIRARPSDQAWVDEVALLLEQAFTSSVPMEEFRRIHRKKLTVSPPLDDDVPF